MSDLIFVAALAAAAYGLVVWGMRVLPGERWQVLASVPRRRGEGDQWQGVNFTWYGFFTASSLTVAVALLIVLSAAAGLSMRAVVLFVVLLCAACLPSARLIARWVEKKPFTFTVGGASFVGVVLAPWVAVGIDRLVPGWALPAVPICAALAVAYAFGEGLGRLACLSFGCCYGKPLEACSPGVARFFERWTLTFTGATKKVAYAGGLEGRRLVPIQALTALVFLSAGVVSLSLFLAGHLATALFVGLAATQLWRAFSELLRADHRGGGRLSPYQTLSLGAVAYLATVVWFLPGGEAANPSAAPGLAALWHPGMLLFLQALWILVFLYTGRSMVTGATLRFHVCGDRV